MLGIPERAAARVKRPWVSASIRAVIRGNGMAMIASFFCVYVT
jgi:hypothetical protein